MGEIRRFFIRPEDIEGDRAVMNGPEVRHLKTVLRLKSGDSVLLFDGNGMEYDACIESFSKKHAVFSLIAQRQVYVESPIHLELAQALIKGRKMDRLVRSCTELGINAFSAFGAMRSTPRPSNWSSRIDRWNKIAVEAAKQSGRVRLPLIKGVDFADLAGILSGYDLGIFFWEKCTEPISSITKDVKKPIKSVLAVVGPEGGFDQSEADALIHAGFRAAGLGPRILRAETAAVSACALIQHCLGDMN